MPRLSIIIVSFNCRADLDSCIESLTSAALQVDYEIVVVDNASTDGTAAHLRERWPGVRLIEAGGNVGFAAANNIGMRQTFGELVLLLNPDTVVPPGAVDALIAVLDGRPEVAAAGPRLVDASGLPEVSFGRMISPIAELRQKVLVRGQARGSRIVRMAVDRMARRSRPVDWVSGACLLARRADLEAAGLFDERYFMYTEDVDLCAALRARGRVVLYFAGATVTHRRGRSASTAPAATAAAYRRSRLAFYDKHHPRWALVLRLYLKLLGR